MESGVVRRRTRIIASHFTNSHEDIISAAASHVLPMSCSSMSLSSIARRLDNRTYFARQSSNSQGPFMRQAASDEQPSHDQNKSLLNANINETPMFSKPVKEVKSMYTDPAPEAPVFARPNRERELIPQTKITKKTSSNELKWSPRMDVAESEFNYFVTLEIPGFSIDNIKVEVNNESLIVTGDRSSSSSCRSKSVCSNKSSAKSSYHKKEILQGPFQFVWPVPTNANKDSVSAEIQDGLLQITIPKHSGLRWLRKANM